MGLLRWILQEKENRAQSDIRSVEGEEIPTTNNRILTILQAYEKIPVVQRGINVIVDSTSSIDIDIYGKIGGIVPKCKEVPRINKLKTILNFEPNPYISAFDFKANVFMDLLTDGNAFIYWDGAFLYNIPATDMVIKTDKIAFVSGYTYNNTSFTPDEIIHIRDNSAKSLYRGDSRVAPALSSINTLEAMVQFQKNFFDNSAVPGVVIKTPNILSSKTKDKIVANWRREYNPKTGGRKPLILDGDFSIEYLGGSNSFKDLDFAASIDAHEIKVLQALGVPPILIDSGNNANISPNLKLFYLNTVLPLFRKYLGGLERFFGYDLKENTQDIEALRPDLTEQGNFLATLTNAGILTRNESRDKIRMPKHPEEFADALILPANIAGSAASANVGGRPADNTGNKPNEQKPKPGS